VCRDSDGPSDHCGSPCTCGGRFPGSPKASRAARRCASARPSRHRDGATRRFCASEGTAAACSACLRCRVLATIPAPGDGGDSGLAWAEGTLWVGQYRARKIYQVDPNTGEILRTIESNRFVTGVTWVDGELWHATWEGDESDLRRVDPQSGEVLESLDMPRGVHVSGLESDGDQFFVEGKRPGRSGQSGGRDAPPRAVPRIVSF
jgi:streptogramin lyase